MPASAQHSSMREKRIVFSRAEWETFWTREHTILFAVALKTLGNEADAEEAVQDALISLVQKGREDLVLTARFKITEQSLEKLKSDSVPSAVLKQLEGMKDQEVRGEKEFLEKLTATIGEEPTVQYKSLILKAAVLTDEKLFEGAVRAFLMRVVYYKAIDILRRRIRNQELLVKFQQDTQIGQPPQSPSPEEQAIEESLLENLLQIVNPRSPKQREMLLFILDHYDNHPQDLWPAWAQIKGLDLSNETQRNSFDKQRSRLRAQLRARFKITEQSLEKLKSDSVPSAVLKQLEGMKDQEVRGEKEFLEKLTATIGEEPTVQYKSLILKAAQLREMGVYTVITGREAQDAN